MADGILGLGTQSVRKALSTSFRAGPTSTPEASDGDKSCLSLL